MKRIHNIQNHPIFRAEYRNLQEAEKERIFCRHTMEHFLDVARLMYIYNLEDGAGIEKDIIYAAALLHDIGRYEQISRGTPHDIAGSRLAEVIMRDCDFTEEEISWVKRAISGHRISKNDEHTKPSLEVYLYRADKRSRNCFLCPAYGECNWPEEKKNKNICY